MFNQEGVKKLLFILLALLILSSSLFLILKFNNPKKFQLIFFDVGQGDSALVNLDNGQKLLIDCGVDNKVLEKLGKYLPFYDRQIDYLIISHFDLDHYGGCIDVLKRYQIKNVIINGLPGIDDYYRAWLEELSKQLPARKVNLLKISDYQKFLFGTTALEFLWPRVDTNLAGDNNNSVILKISHPNFSALFTGDLEELGESELLKKYCPDFLNNQNLICAPLKSEVLKVAHHGSPGASSELWLKAVAPKTAVVSVGENKFGHPSARVLKKLERAGAKILRTDQIGDIILAP